MQKNIVVENEIDGIIDTIKQLKGIRVKTLLGEYSYRGINRIHETIMEINKRWVNIATSVKYTSKNWVELDGTINEYIDFMCDFLKVEQNRVKSPRRFRDLIDAKQMMCYILYNNTSLSLFQIGQIFGGRHHTTILHSIRKHEIDYQIVPYYKTKYDKLHGAFFERFTKREDNIPQTN